MVCTPVYTVYGRSVVVFLSVCGVFSIDGFGRCSWFMVVMYGKRGFSWVRSRATVDRDGARERATRGDGRRRRGRGRARGVDAHRCVALRAGDVRAVGRRRRKVTRARWLDVFRAATPSFARRAATCGEANAESRAAKFQREFDAVCDACEGRAMDEEPQGSARRACRDAGGAEPARPWRRVPRTVSREDGILRACGFVDCFASVKREENDRALGALPDVLRGVGRAARRETPLRRACEACSRGTYSISAPHRRWTCMKMVAVSISRRRWRDSGRDRGASTISAR